MKKYLAFAFLSVLAGCGEMPPPEDLAQDRMGSLVIVCRDGVQYLSTKTINNAYAVTARIKPDGKPYTCGENK